MDDLNTDCITSGVKLAGRQQGVLYGTREVANAALSVTTIADRRIRLVSGGGLSRSSEEVVERQWSEGLSMFSFCSYRQPDCTGKIDYYETRSQPMATANWYIRNVVHTFVIKHEEPYEGRLSRTVL